MDRSVDPGRSTPSLLPGTAVPSLTPKQRKEGMAMTIVEATRSVVGGIDTHSQVHVAAVLDEVGGLLGSESFAADPPGYAALLSWFCSFGRPAKVGVEGTGSYGAGVCRFLMR